MRQGSAAKQAGSTRERILAAAIQRFSRQSYEATGLRDIAADAGVDVAYVHRCYGSKHKLFAEAIHAAMATDHVLAGSPQALADRLASAVFRGDATSAADPFAILIHSLSSPKAAAVLRAYIVDNVIASLSRDLSPPARPRACLIAAFLAGLGILRNVLAIAPLRNAHAGGDVEALVAASIAGMLDAQVARRPRRRAK